MKKLSVKGAISLKASDIKIEKYGKVGRLLL
jgi:serine/threonine protein kinase